MAEAPRKKTVYEFSPLGEAQVGTWINKPDVKFNEAGVFKGPILVTGTDAIRFKDKIDVAAQAYFDEATAEMTPGERKKWQLYVPYEVQEDEEGNPTGGIVFDFKQNATIKLRDGTEKAVKIAIKDSKNADLDKAIFPGTVLRTMYSFRGIKVAGTKQLGVRMDFAAVQIFKLAERSGGSFGNFGELEGGFSQDDQAEAQGGSTDDGGDY
jgi:hypothetical protein